MASTLEGGHRTKVLLYLLKAGPRTKTETFTALRVNPTVFLYSVLPPLVDSGLVGVRPEARGLRKSEAHLLTLTIFGKKVAEHLEVIDELVREASKHAEMKQK